VCVVDKGKKKKKSEYNHFTIANDMKDSVYETLIFNVDIDKDIKWLKISSGDTSIQAVFETKYADPNDDDYETYDTSGEVELKHHTTAKVKQATVRFTVTPIQNNEEEANQTNYNRID
jgi:hypothetical protein